MTVIDIIISLATVFLVGLLWIMLYDSNRFVVRNYHVKDKRIYKNFRMVVLADLHNKRYGKHNEQLLKAIRECEPDLILVAGDIPTAKPKKKLDVAIEFMSELVKDFPVYYGNGNHEHRMKIYPETYGDMYEVYEKALREMGVKLLVNEHACLPEYGITIYGAEIDKYYYTRFGIRPMDQGYLKELLGKLEKDDYSILIAHNPDYFPKYAEWGADLVLSGHIHGGMVRIPFLGKGVVSPNVRFFPKYDGGEFHIGQSTMVLSRGLGMHTIPIRLFNPGEVVVIDFENIS